MRSPSLASLVALLAACSSGSPGPDGGNGTDTGPCDVAVQQGARWADLGAGEDFYEPLADGDPILIVFGPQGGYHLDGSVRVAGVDPGDPELPPGDPAHPQTTFEVRREDGSLASGVPGDLRALTYREALRPTCAEGVFQMAGREIFLAFTDRDLDGETLTITVTVQDPDGITVSNAHEVVAEPSPFN